MHAAAPPILLMITAKAAIDPGGMGIPPASVVTQVTLQGSACSISHPSNQAHQNNHKACVAEVCWQEQLIPQSVRLSRLIALFSITNKEQEACMLKLLQFRSLPKNGHFRLPLL